LIIDQPKPRDPVLVNFQPINPMSSASRIERDLDWKAIDRPIRLQPHLASHLACGIAPEILGARPYRKHLARSPERRRHQNRPHRQARLDPDGQRGHLQKHTRSADIGEHFEFKRFFAKDLKAIPLVSATLFTSFRPIDHGYHVSVTHIPAGQGDPKVDQSEVVDAGTLRSSP